MYRWFHNIKTFYSEKERKMYIAVEKSGVHYPWYY